MTYETAAHRVQTAIATLMELKPDLPRVQPKGLRVGVDLSKSDMAGLATLLIEKGLITKDEYYEAITTAAEQEASSYEKEVQQAYNNPNIKVV